MAQRVVVDVPPFGLPCSARVIEPGGDLEAARAVHAGLAAELERAAAVSVDARGGFVGEVGEPAFADGVRQRLVAGGEGGDGFGVDVGAFVGMVSQAGPGSRRRAPGRARHRLVALSGDDGASGERVPVAESTAVVTLGAAGRPRLA